MTFLLNPIWVLATMAVVLAVNLALFFSLKREIAVLRRDLARDKQHMLSRVELQSVSLSNLGKALQEDPQRQAVPAVAVVTAATPGAPAASANLAKRGHAIRRWRRGESYDQIAQALAMPKAEVELLIKAYRVSAGARAADGSNSPATDTSV